MKKKSKNGEWIYNGNFLITGYAPYKCSKCGTDFHLRTPFCPYCGDKKGEIKWQSILTKKRF